MRSSRISAIVLYSQGWYNWFATFIVNGLKKYAAGSLRAGALQLNETLYIKALDACIGMAYQNPIQYSVSFEAVQLEMF